MNHVQAASALLMVAPTTFGFDEQTAQTNTFQHHLPASWSEVTTKALQEFNAAVTKLRQHGIAVLDFHDSDPTPKPNAVFPNNWLSTWPDGTIFLYPMATPSRRIERSQAVLDLLHSAFRSSAVVDLSDAEAQGRFLESTGAIVFDHLNHIAYACLSPRCDAALFTEHVRKLGYQPHAFHAIASGRPIYHTNVVLAIQTKTAIVCGAAIVNAQERADLHASLTTGGRTVIDITPSQMDQFCGNVLEVKNTQGASFVVLSQTAYDALTPAQRNTLGTSGELIPIAIPTIEAVGGGSARCMLAELFLPHI